nr:MULTISPECIES: CoA transferase [unclassified Bradyrhizobium]
MDKLEKDGVPCGPVNDFDQLFADPHVVERGMRVTVKHKFAPELSLIRNALTLSETPITEYRAPPLLGENTQEVLDDKLAYDEEKITQLKLIGAI